MYKIDEIRKKIQNGIKITASEFKAFHEYTMELVRSRLRDAPKIISFYFSDI